MNRDKSKTGLCDVNYWYKNFKKKLFGKYFLDFNFLHVPMVHYGGRDMQCDRSSACSGWVEIFFLVHVPYRTCTCGIV